MKNTKVYMDENSKICARPADLEVCIYVAILI